MDAAFAQNKVGSAPSCENLTVDFNALFAGLPSRSQGEGYTTAEIMAVTGMSKEMVRRNIRKALDGGICTRSRKLMERIDGIKVSVSAYIFNVKE